MSAHLSRDILLAVAETGHADALAARHLEGCDDCRAEVASLAAALGDLHGADVPEPSPLFWDHFSARVAGAVRDLPPPRAAWWRHAAGWGWTLGGATTAALLLVLAFGPWSASRPPGPTQAPAVALAGADGAAGEDAASPAADGEDWTLLADAFGDVDYDDVRALGASVAPGTTEQAVEDLDASERQELGRLLQEEIARARAHRPAVDTL